MKLRRAIQRFRQTGYENHRVMGDFLLSGIRDKLLVDLQEIKGSLQCLPNLEARMSSAQQRLVKSAEEMDRLMEDQREILRLLSL